MQIIKIISESIQALVEESVISGFLKLIDDYKVVEKLGVSREEE